MRQRLFAAALVLSILALAGSSAQAESGHANHASIFVGATTASSHTSFTLGAEYERRFHELVGVGAFYERIFASGHAGNAAGAGLVIHPLCDFKLMLAPGVEFANGHSSFLFRTGLGYDFHVNQFAITPSFATDFIAGGHVAYVYGLGFGIGF